MDELKQILGELGLSANESAIYLFLLSRGECTTGPIIKGTGIANSRVYESLRTLISRGVVTYVVAADGKHFSAADPAVLSQQLEERAKRLKSALPQLRNLIPLAGVGKSLQTASAIYEGFEGFKTAFKKIIDDCPVGGTINILGFSEELYAQSSLRVFLKNMNAKDKQKKHKLRILLGENVKSTLGRDREREKYSQIRYLPQGYLSPIAVDILDDWVYFFLWDKEPFVFAIHNEKIAKSFLAYFSFLWQIGKPVKK